jgi:hypothetical protein
VKKVVMPAIASVRMFGFELSGVLMFASGYKKTAGGRSLIEQISGRNT